MPYQIKNGIIYSGNAVTLTQAQYDALPTLQKNNGTVYYIYDSNDIVDAEDVGVNGGNVEDLAGSVATFETSQATSSHAVGEYILYQANLYKVIAPIDSGETLTVGSNIESAKVGDELSELKSGLTNLSTQIGGVKNLSISSTGESRTLDILFTDTMGFFRIECMNRRASARPFCAMVQKYNATTNYVVLSNYATDESAFTCSNISGGIRVTLPFTYAGVMVSSATNFTLSVVS